MFPPEELWDDLQLTNTSQLNYQFTFDGTLDASDEYRVGTAVDEVRTTFSNGGDVPKTNVNARFQAGSTMLLVEVNVPPYKTAEEVERAINATLLAQADELSFSKTISPSVADMLGQLLMARSSVTPVTILVNPNAPNTFPTDTSIIAMSTAGVFGLFMFIFIARECTPDRLRETTRLVIAVFNGLWGRGGQMPSSMVEKASDPVVLGNRPPVFPSVYDRQKMQGFENIANMMPMFLMPQVQPQVQMQQFQVPPAQVPPAQAPVQPQIKQAEPQIKQVVQQQIKKTLAPPPVGIKSSL